MSVKRYDTECGYGCSHGSYELEDGPWVRWEDYARLKAEVERLRKAGDAMALCITEFRCGKYGIALDKVGGFYVWQDWLAAKEGKPSV